VRKHTGDGAGILIQIPHSFSSRVAVARISLPAPEEYGVGAFFNVAGTSRNRNSVWTFSSDSSPRGQEFLGWRRGPRPRSSLGESARQVEPGDVGTLSSAEAPPGRRPKRSSASSMFIRNRFGKRSKTSGLEITSISIFSEPVVPHPGHKGMPRPNSLAGNFADDLGNPPNVRALCACSIRALVPTRSRAGSSPTVSHDLAQRRDQHVAGKHQLDEGARGLVFIGSL